MTYLNLFAGCGGWELGLDAAGVPWTDSLGIDPRAGFVATREAAGYRTRQAESEDLIGVRHVGHGGTHRGLVGQPPCPTFSMSGRGTGRRAIPSIQAALDEIAQGQTFQDVVERHAWEDPRTKGIVIPMAHLAWAARSGDPYDWVILEEVPPALPVFETYATLLRERFGYSTWTGLLRGEQFGLPQYRKRAVLMARQPTVILGAIPDPTPTHQRYKKGIPQGVAYRPQDEGLRPWVSMYDAIGRGAVHRPAGTLGTGVGYTSWARKHMYAEWQAGLWMMAEDDPSRITETGQLHPNLSVAEVGVLQGFPADHPWRGSVVSQRAQAGSAMPPQFVTACATTLLTRAVLDSGEQQLPLAV